MGAFVKAAWRIPLITVCLKSNCLVPSVILALYSSIMPLFVYGSPPVMVIVKCLRFF